MGGQNHPAPTARAPKTVSPCFGGGRPLQNSRKTDFDPEDGRFSPWTYIFWIYTKHWLDDMGVKTILRPLQGVWKRLSPFFGGWGRGHGRPLQSFQKFKANICINQHKTAGYWRLVKTRMNKKKPNPIKRRNKKNRDSSELYLFVQIN